MRGPVPSLPHPVPSVHGVRREGPVLLRLRSCTAAKQSQAVTPLQLRSGEAAQQRQSQTAQLRSGEVAKQHQHATARVRRAFAFFWNQRLTDQGRDLVLCLGAVPGAIVTGTALAMIVAQLVQGAPA